MDKTEIRNNVLNGILGYLTKQPYIEVAQLIEALRQDMNSHREKVESGNKKD